MGGGGRDESITEFDGGVGVGGERIVIKCGGGGGGGGWGGGCGEDGLIMWGVWGGRKGFRRDANGAYRVDDKVLNWGEVWGGEMKGVEKVG